MRNFTPTFDKEPDACEFEIGQSLWAKHGRDCRAWIVQDVFRRGMFGDWAMYVVPENDLTGPLHFAWAHEMTDKPSGIPSLHPEHQGIVVFTGTGRPLKAIEGGFPELRSAS